MYARVDAWKQAADARALFLECYAMMTHNMFGGIAAGEFCQRDWAQRLLLDFAGYYFRALEAYERDPAAAPAVWRHAFEATTQTDASPLQKLLLGVNAHINFDLAMTLDDLLHDAWPGLSRTQRKVYQTDYETVNRIIARTIDAVQDQVLEPAMPIMERVDVIFGPADEWAVARLIGLWRDKT